MTRTRARRQAVVILLALAFVTGLGDAIPAFAQTDPVAHLVSDGLLFGELQVGQSREQQMTVTNDGTDDAGIADYRLEGSGRSSFAFEDLPQSTLGAGRSDRFRLRFQPRTTGTKRAELVYRYHTRSDGTGEEVEARFPILGTAIDHPPPLVSTPSRLRFSGLVADRVLPDGQTSSVELRNRSSANVRISTVDSERDTGLGLRTGAGCDGRTLAPGESCTFSVEASIRFGGTFDGQLVLRTDSTHPEIRIPVTASGRFGPDDEAPEMRDVSLPRPVKAYPGTERRVRVSMRWSGRDDQLVAGYQAQWRLGTGSWHWFLRQVAPFTPPYSPRTSAVVTVPTGRITFRVRSVDHAGNTSRWMTSAYTIGYQDIKTSNTRRTGTWATQRVPKGRSIGGSVLVGRHTGSHLPSVRSTLSAKVVALVARTTPRSAIARVSSPDQAVREDASLYSSKVTDLRIVAVEEYSESALSRTWTVQALRSRSRNSIHLDAWIFVR
jgi:hypothetical protein